MNRWSKINIALAVLAAALLAWQWVATDSSHGERLTDIDPTTIKNVRIERDKQLVLALQRTANAWQLSFPDKLPAETSRILPLLAIARATTTQCFTPDGDLTPFGLTRPSAVLQLDQLRIAFGDRDPSQRLRYALVDDSVCAVDELYFSLLTLPTKHFIAK